MANNKTGLPEQRVRTGKYLKYAIGEIVLVVIGILIALSINNWNESRKVKIELAYILKIIKNDLIADTLAVSEPLNNYKATNQTIQKLLNKEIPMTYFDTINELNFEKCEYCRHQASLYNHIFIKDKGVELLKQYKNTSKDTILSSLLSFHKKFREWFADDTKFMMEMVRKNRVDLEKHEWYPNFSEKKHNADYVDYISESSEYRSKLSTYKYYSKTVILDIEEFKEIAKNYINILDELDPVQ
jgi:hypothetical protein